MIGNRKIAHPECYKKISQANKIVFFCGSAISSFRPSNIVSGTEIKKSVIEQFNHLLKRYCLEDIGIQQFFNLPLETIIDIGSFVMREKPESRNLALLRKYFIDVAPNKIHFYIASYLYFHKNLSVITTNYDDGIENAYNFMANILGPTRRKLNTYSIKNINQITELKFPSIYKIHGCANIDSSQDLVFTTRQETNIFNQRIFKLFNELFSDSLVIFMGYSFSEPDCFEALFDVKNYEVIWFYRKIEEVQTNPRITLLLENAKDYYLVEDLNQLINKPIDKITEFLQLKNNVRGIVNSIEQEIINSNHQRKNINRRKRGEILFTKNFESITKEKFVKGLISGFLQIRNFQTVNELLKKYKTIREKDDYFLLFSDASITRDLNNRWDLALDSFRKSQLVANLRLEDIYSAKIEELGLETLLNQNNKRLIEIETDLEILKNEIETLFALEKRKKDFIYTALLGRVQKNIVQNLCYQRDFSEENLNKAFNLIDQAIINLNDSRQIHPRIESERFKGRLYYKKYKKTRNKVDMENAIYWTRKSLFLFSLLEGQMGRINAQRQYIHYLIEYGDYLEAERQLHSLLKETEDSRDKLSYQKTLPLQAILYIRTKRYLKAIYALIKFKLSTIYLPGINTPPMNIFKSIIWLIKYLNGTAG